MSTIPVLETATVQNSGVNQCFDITRYSKLTKLYRVTAYVLRFINNLKATMSKMSGPLTATELNQSQKLWITATQQEIFFNELANLQSGSSPRLPLVRQLRLYLNKEGIICCGGRIHNAPVSHTTKFPILLPRKHRLTELIVRDTHEKHFHAGTNSTVTYIRQRYWIPVARQCVKNILRNCVVCNKLSGNHYKAPNPPPLPKHRVQMMEPFTVTGIDFTGALYIRAPEGENKVYICLFTCASTRAVHLEVVTDLSEETFLQAFCRFSSRKSLPRIVLSDNASTFMHVSCGGSQGAVWIHCSTGKSRQSRHRMEIYTTSSSVVWWILGTPSRLDEKCHQEDAWSCIYHLAQPTNDGCGN